MSGGYSGGSYGSGEYTSGYAAGAARARQRREMEERLLRRGEIERGQEQARLQRERLAAGHQPGNRSQGRSGAVYSGYSDYASARGSEGSLLDRNMVTADHPAA